MAEPKRCPNWVWKGGEANVPCNEPVAIIAGRESKYCDSCIQIVTTAAYAHVLSALSKLGSAQDAYRQALSDCYPEPIYD